MSTIKPDEYYVFCEDWIEQKLRKRLKKYKDRYPNFNVERVMRVIEGWDEKSQKWSPYMADKDIQAITKSIRFWRRMVSLAENEHL